MRKHNDRVPIENISSPGRTERVDKAKYDAMKVALLRVLPRAAPGLTVADAKAQLLPILSRTQFPGGEKAGWWLKAVQLDLEAKRVIARENTKAPSPSQDVMHIPVRPDTLSGPVRH